MKVGYDRFENFILTDILYCKMYVIMNLLLYGSQISSHDMQMAYDLALTTHIQILSTYWMI